MRIDQAGLAVGINGRSRTDGLLTTALVTLTSTGSGSTHLFRFLWVPESDTSAAATIAPTSATVWTFTPSANAYGTYRIELVVDQGLATEKRQIRTFVRRSPVTQLVVPSPNEAADPTASLIKNTTFEINANQSNEAYGAWVTGSAWGWYRYWKETVDYLEGARGLSATSDVGVGVFDAAVLDSSNVLQKADVATAAHLYRFVGFCVSKPTTTTALYQNSGSVQLGSTTPGTVYWVGSGGSITSTMPATSGQLRQRVGIGLASNQLLIQIGEPIIVP